MDGLVGFQLQQLGEGFSAVFAAQRLLVLAVTLLLCSTSMGLGLCDTFRSGGESWVTFIWIFWFQLVVWVVIIVLAQVILELTRIRGRLVCKSLQSLLLYYHRLDTVLISSAFPQVNYR